MYLLPGTTSEHLKKIGKKQHPEYPPGKNPRLFLFSNSVKDAPGL